MRGAEVYVSERMARVEADGQILILSLTPVVQSMISAAGKMPRLEFGVVVELQPVVGERKARPRTEED